MAGSYHASVTTADLVEHLRRLETELVSLDVWQSRAELEARMSPDFIEIGSEDFAVRELATGVALVTYRSVIDQGGGSAPLIALRSSIWRREGDRWRMELHQITRLASPSA
jgi:hypothetical protein